MQGVSDRHNFFRKVCRSLRARVSKAAKIITPKPVTAALSALHTIKRAWRIRTPTEDAGHHS